MIQVNVIVKRNISICINTKKKINVEITKSKSCYPVTILDQDNDIITTVPSGGSYHVLVFSGIKDNGAPYTNSIVDNA